MRILFIATLLAAAGCGSSDGRATNLLCAYCTDDSQCGGNPCFEDASGFRFCGRTCEGGCPSGFSCIGLMGTGPGVVETCFPDNEACQSSIVPDGGVFLPVDLSGPQDGSGKNPGGTPVGGPIGPTGGTVDRLFFGITGDTRPSQCGSAYPQAVINSIYTGFKSKGVQFVVDQGDHMFNCGYGAAAVAGAQQQLGYYLAAANILGKTVFMTMGNHECSGSSSSLCSPTASNGPNPNYTAFMQAMAPISNLPYYRFDVTTNTGLAVFIVIADDAWDATQQSWLTTQLTDADAHAKYTFVSKHHPDGNTDHPEFQMIYDLVRQHRYTLFFTGHSHLYKREHGDPRAMVLGCGGAPLAGGNFFGYGTVEQGVDDRIYVNVYDQATGNVMDQFDVGPQ
ncbi:MAG TPA: metallophosphoesterase [Polyangia bacterium]|nr:metallophosphoesterase [Polyangia bacterium]